MKTLNKLLKLSLSFLLLQTLFSACAFQIGKEIVSHPDGVLSNAKKNKENMGKEFESLEIDTFGSYSGSYNYNFTKKYEAGYDGNVSYKSDEKGIHISVDINDEKKYDKIVLFKLENGLTTEIAYIQPNQEYYHYMEKEDVPVGLTVKKVDKETGVETTVKSSLKTNYLTKGTYTFDLFFLEPGKSYNLLVSVRENEGIFSDIFGNRTDYDEKTQTSSYREHFLIYHTSDVLIDATATSNTEGRKLKATYDNNADTVTFEYLNFTNSIYPFGIKSLADVTYKTDITYIGTSNSNSKFVVNYENKDNQLITYKISDILGTTPGIEYGKDYVISDVKTEFSYVSHLDDNFSDSMTDAEKQDYYKRLYAQTKYIYSENYTSKENLPKTIAPNDNRLPITGTATTEGNVISFKLPCSCSEINIYRYEDPAKPQLAGTMTGSFEADKQYSFTDYLGEPGKTYSYYITYGSLQSKTCSVQTRADTTHYPNVGELTFDSYEKSFTLVKNPFEDKVPSKYSGKMEITYEYSYTDSTGYTYKSAIPVTVNSGSSYVDSRLYNYSNSDRKAVYKAPIKVTYSSFTPEIQYNNYGELASVSDFVKELQFYSKQELEKNEEFRKKIIEYRKENEAKLNPKTEDLPYIISLSEVDEGIDISVHIPSWMNYLQIIRADTIDGISSYWSYYDFNMDNFVTGDVKVTDYSVKKDHKYRYWLSYYYYVDEFNGGISCGQYGSDKEKSINCTKDSPYKITTFPVVKYENNSIILKNTGLAWNKLPEGYSNSSDYLGTYKQLEYTSHYVSGQNIYLVVSKTLANKDVLKYECTEIDIEDVYYVDEYGNKTDSKINYSKNQLTKGFEWESSTYKKPYEKDTLSWHKQYVYNEQKMIKGKYSVSEVEAGMFNDKGFWMYRDANFDSTAANTTFTAKSESK